MSVGVEPCWPQTESVFDRSRILVLQRTRMYDVDTGCQCLVRVPSKERERESARATEREQSQRLDVVLQTAGDWRKQTVVACYGTSRAAPRRAAPERCFTAELPDGRRPFSSSYAHTPLLQFVVDLLYNTLYNQGRRSIWDRGDTSPNIWTGGTLSRMSIVPLNISRVLSATFYPCNIFLISWKSF